MSDRPPPSKKMGTHDKDRPTTRMLAAPVTSAGRLHLATFAASGSATHSLPGSGEIRIGRGVDCDVQILDESISRHHAILYVGEDNIRLVDLGSANGTFIGGQRLLAGDAVPVPLGTVIAFGAVTAIVQRAPASARLRPIRTHDYFATRLEDECVRAAAAGASFAVLAVRTTAGRARDAEEALGKRLRPMDLVAVYAPDEYEVLVVDVDRAAATAMVDELAAALAASAIAASVGIAVFPTDARSAAALTAAARRVGPAAIDATMPPVLPTVGILERMRPLVERVAASEISVLVLGETGVGKELLATMVHELSPRASRPLLSLNCAALGESLLESELFGYERGAFTGAVTQKQGLLESAEGGTIFLDEVGEMPLTVQAKLLRVLERREVMRLGALRPKAINVRFVAATNRDLEALAEAGHFRQDLFFRLNGVTLVLPPLRERTNEIEQLAIGILTQACARAGRPTVPRIAPEAFALMRRYNWPGNIRELRNVLERAILLCGDVITLAHLPTERLGRSQVDTSVERAQRTSIMSQPQTPQAMPAALPVPGTMEPLARGFSGSSEERRKIEIALAQAGGNQGIAAKLLGVSRRTLVTRMEQYNFPRPRKSDASE